MGHSGGTRRHRYAQLKSVQLFAATDGVIALSNGTDAITRQATVGFVKAVYSMFLRDFNIDLKRKVIEDGTYILFDYLESQTLNEYIDPELGLAYGRALALAVMELGYHKEQPKRGGRLTLKKIRPVLY
jgi:hypothetical protein